MSQKRPCLGFQSNLPTAVKMSVAFSYVDVLVCASVLVCWGGTVPCESSGRCRGGRGWELGSEPRVIPAQSPALLCCRALTAVCPWQQRNG